MRGAPVFIALVCLGLLASTAAASGFPSVRAGPQGGSGAATLVRPLSTVALGSSHVYGGYGVIGVKSGLSLSGEWKIPKVHGGCPSKLEGTFVGVGVGGYSTPAYGVSGTETVCYLGSASYSSYYQIGLNSFSGSLPVAPGDHMRAGITYSTTFHRLGLYLDDLTKGTSVSNYGTVTVPKHTDALWVAESERSTGTGKLIPLVDFGNATFTQCTATLNGTTAYILGHYSNTAIEMYDHTGLTFKADVGVITPNHKGFTVHWQSAGP